MSWYSRASRWSCLTLVAYIAVVGVVTPMAAQTPPPKAGSSASPAPANDTAVTQAAATITAAALAEPLAVLTADSLRGRGTPSAALERAATYLEARFRQLGLDADRLLYPLPGQLIAEPKYSWIWIMIPDPDTSKHVPLAEFYPHFTTAAYFAPEVGPPVVSQRDEVFFTAGVGVLLAGRYTAKSLPLEEVRNKVVIYVPFAGTDSAARRQILTRLYDVSAGIVVTNAADSAAFAAAQRKAAAQPVPIVDQFMRAAMLRNHWPWAAVIHPDTARALVTALGLDLARLQADSTPLVRDLSRVSVWLVTKPPPGAEEKRQTAPVVFATLQGSDSVLAREYVAITAHLDGDAKAGVDDNNAGVAGLLALAQAFGQPGARPRRSLIFVATSGGGVGQNYWGANAFADPRGQRPHLVSALNLDMIGRLRGGDSLLIDGLADIDFPSPPKAVAAAHPELRLKVANGGNIFQQVSDHFPFARRGVPSLFLHTAKNHAAANAAADTIVRPEDTARLLRFAFYLTTAIANSDKGPRWNAEGRRRFDELMTP